ncbi:hypothetical protein [uncultured Cellulomonas sp.]|uniref:hypothetical protein n=1 Tax=uncultured Cellulomonas sp. TaxID=189682 RepID=UPI0028EA3838|nr:hypothetical protein [uncultured Cellulomonas sp.]
MHRRHIVALVGALVLVGAVATAWANRPPPPLPPLAVETLAPPTGIDLPAHVVAGGDDGTAFSLDAPVEGQPDESIYTIPLEGPPAISSFGVFWTPLRGPFRSLDAYTDRQRRDPESSQLVGEPVVEHSALGAAVRKELVMTTGVTITQWAVEHDDHLYLVEWYHRPDDDTWRPTVEAMIASWHWG